MRTRTLAILLLAALALAPGMAYAAPEPDTREIVTANGYGDVLESGDLMVVIRYHVDYDACCPEETAEEAVIGRYMDTSTGERVRAAGPFAFVNSGYGQGIISIYFSAADASSLGITHGDMDTAEIAGSPSVFPSPWQEVKDITWRSQGSQSALENDLRDIAEALELRPEWAGVDLITTLSGVRKLQPNGEEYFENSIPNLRLMVPNLFQAVLESPDHIERDFERNYETSLEQAWDGTIFANIFSGMSTRHGVPEPMIKTGFSFAVALLAMGGVGVFLMREGVDSRTVAGVSALVFAAIIGFLAYQGLVPLQLIAVIGFGAFVYIIFKLWLRRSV